MSNKARKIFPRRKDGRRSIPFTVGCGEYAKITAYGMCPGVCVRISEIHENACTCESYEMPFCIAGGPVGVDEDCPRAAIPLPGCYVAYLCVEEGMELPEDYAVYVETCTNVENLQVVVTAGAING